MATLTKNQLGEGISATQTFDADESLKTTLLVIGLTSTDETVVFEALEHTSVPAFYSSPTGHNNLVLIRRTASMIPGEKTSAFIELEYASKANDRGNFVFSGATTLLQETTEVDRAANQITVSHTWPSDDPDFADLTQTQGAEVPGFLPTTGLRAEGTLQRDYPWQISQEWVGSINSTAWATAPLSGQWMCTSVDFKPHDWNTSPKTWLFTFEFSYKTGGWAPGVVFTDSRTGRPPSGLVSGVGFKTVSLYQFIDFNTLFPI